MKEDIHPAYRPVLFIDSATGKEWMTRSTATSSETRVINGEEVPVVRLDISSDSHPMWTGVQRHTDSEGRIGRFRRRFAKKAVQ